MNRAGQKQQRDFQEEAVRGTVAAVSPHLSGAPQEAGDSPNFPAISRQSLVPTLARPSLRMRPLPPLPAGPQPSWSPTSSIISKYSIAFTHGLQNGPPRRHRGPSTTRSLSPHSLESQPPLCNPQFCETGASVPVLQMGQESLGCRARQKANSRAEVTTTKTLFMRKWPGP